MIRKSIIRKLIKRVIKLISRAIKIIKLISKIIIKLIRKAILLSIGIHLFAVPCSHAFLGDAGAGWAQVPYLANILSENMKRYEQLRVILETEKNKDNYLRLINEGLENSVGLLHSLPIKDAKILSGLKDFNRAYKSIVKVYGEVPPSMESTMQMLHDQSVAESIKMVGFIGPYTKRQEQNSKILSMQSRGASPKGAMRMTAESNAKILHTLNQILKINGQILKLQGEYLAMTNKYGKDSVVAFNRLNKDMKSGLKSLKPDFSLRRFK